MKITGYGRYGRYLYFWENHTYYIKRIRKKSKGNIHDIIINYYIIPIILLLYLLCIIFNISWEYFELS